MEQWQKSGILSGFVLKSRLRVVTPLPPLRGDFCFATLRNDAEGSVTSPLKGGRGVTTRRRIANFFPLLYFELLIRKNHLPRIHRLPVNDERVSKCSTNAVTVRVERFVQTLF